MPVIDTRLKRFFYYVRPYRWWIAGATLSGLLKFNIPVVFPWLLKDIIDHLVSAPRPDASHIHAALAAMVGLYAFWTIVAYLRSFLADGAAQRMIFDLRHDLYQHLQRLSLGFYERWQVGAITSRLLADVATAQNMVGAAFTNVVMDLSSLLLIGVLLFWVNWKLALVSIAILPLYALLNRHYKLKIKDTSRRAQNKMEELSGTVHEKIAAMSIVQAYVREKGEERRFFHDTRTYLSYLLANVHNNALANAVIGFLTSVAPVLVVWYGAMQVMRAELTVGELVAFYAYLGMFYSPLNRLTELNILVANSRAAIDRIFEVLDTAPQVADNPNGRDMARCRGEIRFENVSFGYDPAHPALREVNLHIAPGSTVALVGPSGAGKSTFIKLIPRFYDVTFGSVTIDGINVRDLRLKSLRNQIALVPQEPVLFSGTIAENIAYGRWNATIDEIRAAAIAADAHEFITRLPEGYASNIGERGLKLSGGQKQRLALARAFLKDAPILILDEATSSLDSESENAIGLALKRLMRGRTTIVIAHRLSTIQAADRIVAFEDGRICEAGAHAELLQRPDGVYRRLFDEQFGRVA